MNMPRPIALAAILGALLALGATPARAERADRDKPVHLEADRVHLDDVAKVQVFEGRVVLTQGTTQLRTDKLVVTQDADGFHKGVATGGTGGLAYFRQKRDNSDDYVEGEGERIEYDARNDRTQFFQRAWVKSGQDEVKGQYISYDALTEKYVVNNGDDRKAAQPGVPPGRVRAVIQPKSKTPPPPDPTPALGLKPAGSVTPPAN